MKEIKEPNVCKFNADFEYLENINVLNFVLEKDFSLHKFKTFSYYRLHLVKCGSGYLDTFSRRYELKAGDVFLTEPSTSFCLTDVEGLSVLFISFVGLAINGILKRITYARNNIVIANKTELIPFWESSLYLCGDENIDLIAEGVLKYSFGTLARPDKTRQPDKYESYVLKIKTEMENRFADPDLELRTLCEENYLSPKYVSRIFTKRMGVTFSQYLFQLRMNNASKLIENGFTSVKQIAVLSGFNDTSYFARAFKKNIGVTPTEYIENNGKIEKPS